MNQKLNDLKILLQNDKRFMWGGIFLLVVFLFMVVLPGKSGQGPRTVTVADTDQPKNGMGTPNSYQELVEAFKTDIDTSKRDQAEMRAVLDRNGQDLKNQKEQVAGIFESMVDKIENLGREVDSLAAALKHQQEVYTGDDKRKPEEEGGLEPFGLEPAPIPTPPPPLPKLAAVSVIAPGDSVSVELITGVNAPVDGTPYPVVFKLNGPIEGPDGSQLDLGEARLIAAAQGSESDSRVLYRLSNISFTHPNGRRSVVKIDGWIVGEDGIRGMSGRLIDKLGRLIVATAGVSFAAALGQKLDQGNRSGFRNGNGNGNTGLTVNQRDFDFATASALTDASNRLGQILLNRYESLVPVVEVLPNREAVAIFSTVSEISVIDGEGGPGGEGGEASID